MSQVARYLFGFIFVQAVRDHELSEILHECPGVFKPWSADDDSRRSHACSCVRQRTMTFETGRA